MLKISRSEFENGNEEVTLSRKSITRCGGRQNTRSVNARCAHAYGSTRNAFRARRGCARRVVDQVSSRIATATTTTTIYCNRVGRGNRVEVVTCQFRRRDHVASRRSTRRGSRRHRTKPRTFLSSSSAGGSTPDRYTRLISIRLCLVTRR